MWCLIFKDGIGTVRVHFDTSVSEVGLSWHPEYGLVWVEELNVE